MTPQRTLWKSQRKEVKPLRKLLLALLAAAALTGGMAGSALAGAPDTAACNANPNANGALQAAFADLNPCSDHR